MFLQDYAKRLESSTFFCKIMHSRTDAIRDRAERIRLRRTNLGFATQLDLANAAGVSARTIASLESESEQKESFQTAKLEKVAKALKCEVDWMMTGKVRYSEHQQQHSRMEETPLLRSTLQTLRSQAQSMIQQIDLLERQMRKPDSGRLNSKPDDDATAAGEIVDDLERGSKP